MTTAVITDAGTDVNGPVDAAGREVRARRLGGLLLAVRNRDRVTSRAAAERMGIAPMTYRRLEQGRPVWDQTLLSVDEHLGLVPGMTARALADDAVMASLVRRVQEGESDADAVAEMVERVRGWDPASTDPQMVRELMGALTDHVVARIQAETISERDRSSGRLQSTGR